MLAHQELAHQELARHLMGRLLIVQAVHLILVAMVTLGLGLVLVTLVALPFQAEIAHQAAVVGLELLGQTGRVQTAELAGQEYLVQLRVLL